MNAEETFTIINYFVCSFLTRLSYFQYEVTVITSNVELISCNLFSKIEVKYYYIPLEVDLYVWLDPCLSSHLEKENWYQQVLYNFSVNRTCFEVTGKTNFVVFKIKIHLRHFFQLFTAIESISLRNFNTLTNLTEPIFDIVYRYINRKHAIVSIKICIFVNSIWGYFINLKIR